MQDLAHAKRAASAAGSVHYPTMCEENHALNAACMKTADGCEMPEFLVESTRR